MPAQQKCRLPPDYVSTIPEDGFPGQESVVTARRASHSGYICKVHLWVLTGSKGFQLTRGPCSVLAMDCGIFVSCSHYSAVSEPRGTVWFLECTRIIWGSLEKLRSHIREVLRDTWLKNVLTCGRCYLQACNIPILWTTDGCWDLPPRHLASQLLLSLFPVNLAKDTLPRVEFFDFQMRQHTARGLLPRH